MSLRSARACSSSPGPPLDSSTATAPARRLGSNATTAPNGRPWTRTWSRVGGRSRAPGRRPGSRRLGSVSQVLSTATRNARGIQDVGVAIPQEEVLNDHATPFSTTKPTLHTTATACPTSPTTSTAATADAGRLSGHHGQPAFRLGCWTRLTGVPPAAYVANGLQRANRPDQEPTTLPSSLSA